MSTHPASEVQFDPERRYKYWAFISYSHADDVWGAWLHKALERYRVPRGLVGRNMADGKVPRGVKPIFRDREELASASSLPQRINEALAQSRHLIIVCSPRSAVSRWVNEEIKTFKKLGREDRVLCLIVDGEPNATDKPDSGTLEAFPQAIRFQVGPDGELTGARAEPIAADARKGKDGKANAKLKLLAGLLGVGFDELYECDRRRRLWQRVQLFGVAMLVLSVIGAVWWNRQQLAERQRQIAFARQLAARSDASLKSWPLRSVLLALEAVKQGHDPQGRPIVAAEQALRHALGATGGILLRGHDDALTVVAFSPDGRWLASGSHAGTARLWELTGQDPGARSITLKGQDSALNTLIFSPDGGWVATAGGDGRARLWKVTDVEEIRDTKRESAEKCVWVHGGAAP